MKRLLASCAIVLAWPLLTAAADEPQAAPWEGPAFSASAEAILAALPELTPSVTDDYELILHEQECELTADGRRTLRTRMMYRVLSQRFIDNGEAVVSDTWSPWMQQRPRIQARVITPDGQVHELDPATLGDAPVTSDNRHIYTDARVLQAPLPAVRVGAVVEHVREVQDTRTFCAEGVVIPFVLSPVLERGVARVRVVAPQEMSLQHKVETVSLQPVVERRNGQQILQWESRSQTPLVIELLAPRNAGQLPAVVVGTGSSWTNVARSYHALMTQQVQGDVPGQPLRQLVEQLVEETDSREQKIQKLLAYQQSNIRYTGVEFGEASIVPRPATQTLQRRYGDCKDQSLLLKDLLDAAGIESRVALVSAGTSRRLDRDLPALNWFNHMLVHVPGNPELWIDPVVPFYPVGALPDSDQGRLALIIDPATRELVKTPAGASSDNQRQESFEIRMSELRPLQIDYGVSLHGGHAAEFRRVVAANPLESNRAQWKQSILADTDLAAIDDLSFSRVEDLHEPFRMQVRGTGGEGLGLVHQTQGVVRVDPVRVLHEVPWALVYRSPVPDEEEPRQRRHPLQLPRLSVRETEYRIIPPPGFDAAELPESVTRRFGPATFTSQYDRRDDASIVVTCRFDTGDGLLQPEEWNSLKDWLLEAREHGQLAVYLTFEQIAARHLQEGNLREAFAEYRKLLKADSDNALYHAQYSGALLSAGFGTSSLQAARRAVELQPDTAAAQAALGSALLADPLGRVYHRRTDLPDAEQALREAIRLDPEHVDALWSLIGLLERNARGDRYAAGSRLEEAEKLYRTLWELTPQDATLETSYALNLLHSGRVAELQAWARGRQPSLDLYALQAAGQASARDAAAAIEFVSRLRLSSDERRQVLATAGDQLAQIGHYPQAAELTTAALDGLPAGQVPYLEASAQLLKKTSRLSEVQFAVEDPRSVVQSLLALVWSGEDDPQAIHSHFAQTVPRDGEEYELVTQEREVTAAHRQYLLDNYQSAALMVDRVSQLQFEVTGQTEAFTTVTVSRQGEVLRRSLVVREEEAWRIQDPGPRQSALGRRALFHLDHNEPGLAQAWLEAAYAAQKDQVGWVNEFAGSPFGRLWFERRQPTDKNELRIAAAALAAASDDVPPAVVTILKEALEDIGDRPRLQVQRALSLALYRSDPAAVIALMAQPWEQQPFETEFVHLRLYCLAMLERWEEVEQLCGAVSDQFRFAGLASVYRAEAAIAAGNYSKAAEILLEMLEESPQDTMALRQLTRLALVDAHDVADVRRRLQTVAAPTTEDQRRILLSLAALNAAEGNETEAYGLLVQSLQSEGRTKFDDPEWYVIGRRAEALGLPDIALQAYRRVKPPEKDDAALSVYDLVRHRMTALGEAK